VLVIFSQTELFPTKTEVFPTKSIGFADLLLKSLSKKLKNKNWKL